MSYGELTCIVEKNKYKFLEKVDIKIIDSLLSDAIKTAQEMEEKREADVFVCSGNSRLSRFVSNPFIEIRATGYDLLIALKKAREYSDRVVIMVHADNRICYLDEISDMFSISIVPLTYNNNDEIREVLSKLVLDGINNVIGSGIVVEIGRELGINSTLIYSEDSVRTALDTATNIALSKKAETEKAERFRKIMDFSYEGIIATDENGMVTVINPAAEKILKINKESITGNPIQNVFLNNEFEEVIKEAKKITNRIQTVGDIEILGNIVPFLFKNEISGAVATFQNFNTIQKAEEQIRKKQHEKGLFAKSTFKDILGHSNPATECKSRAFLFAKSDSTLLITGESGTGKELFAQSIHNAGNRALKPFVAINCQALTDTLLESELFGYEDGAFTGAKKGGKPGFFELAHNGTIFLDEIGEIPPMLQSRLLRVLEEREVMRIGGSKIIPVNIRVLAATNVDLLKRVYQGKFRQDLFYRLNVLELDIPPLRMRKKDLPLLVSRFLSDFRKDLNDDEIAEIANNPMFYSYDWPGNIRELKNIVERFAVLYDTTISASDLLDSIFSKQLRHRSVVSDEYTEIARVLDEFKGNKTEAAKHLGMSRTTLWKKLKEYAFIS